MPRKAWGAISSMAVAEPASMLVLLAQELLPLDNVHCGAFPAGTCDNNAVAVAVNAASAQGLISAAAAGNSGNKAALSAPACASRAVAVGAVYSTDTSTSGICASQGIQKDKVTCFSNRWDFTTASW
jgi:subtilisin family serine protease